MAQLSKLQKTIISEPPENCQKMSLGGSSLLKNVKILSQDNFFTILGQKYGRGLRPLPKEGRRPSAAASLLDSMFVQIYMKSCPKNDMLICFHDFESPEDDVFSICRGSSEIVDLVYFHYLVSILQGPSGIHQN